jgi:predicted dehydrogenase
MQSGIGVGVVGAGAMGRVYCECLRRYVSGGTLVAVTGGTRAAGLAREYEVAAEPSVESMLARRDIAAVVIATPETMHATQSIAAVREGKHVLVEKPMAPDVAQCDAMITASEKASVKLMVVKHWRFRGVHTRALEILRSGELGSVRSVHNQTNASLDSSLGVVGKKQFYLDPEGGGLLMGWTVHNLDWVCHILGVEPRDARTVEPPRRHPMIGLTHLHARLEFAGGVVASVKVSIDLPEVPRIEHVFRTTVVAERGELELDGYGALEVVKAGERELRWVQPPLDPANATDPERLVAYASMVQAFINAIRNDLPPPVSGQDGRRAVALFRSLCAPAQRT